MSAYAWLSQGLLGSVDLFGRTDVAERIKNGDIAVDFSRPLDVQGASVTLAVGRSLFALLPRGIPSVLIGVLFVGTTMPTTPLRYVLGALSVLPAIVASRARTRPPCAGHVRERNLRGGPPRTELIGPGSPVLTG